MSLRSLKQSVASILFGVRSSFEDIDEPARRRIRAAQIDAVVQLVPLTMTINLLTAAIIIYLFSDDGAALFLTVWGASFVLAAAVSFWSWKRSRRNRPRGTSARGIRRIILYATFFGGLWGAVAYVLFPTADTMHQLFLAALMAGLISGGAFALSTVPAAALAYTWIVVLGMGGALLLAAYSVFETVAFMLCVYAVFLSRNICAHGQLFMDRLHDELKLEAQRELIGLLLNDFEEHASDWLWETDASGVLVRVSDRFAEAAGKTPAELQGAEFADVLCGGCEYQPPELEDVLKRMAWRTPFRDVVVPVEIGEDMHYWLLSGKPIFDGVGKFLGYHGVGADVTDKRVAEERISRLAYYDSLTGLPNRAALREEVDSALTGACERGESASLLCLDLDQFKSINDTLGHSVGDALLKSVAQRVRACARGRDIVARLGGDEFAIMQVNPVLPLDTMILARQLLDAFAVPFKVEHHNITISTCIGIAIAPADGWDTDALLKKADLALYAAKAEGVGTYRFFEPAMEAWANRRRSLEVGLRSAVENGEIEVVFQPLVDLRKGTIAACEALARWNSPEWGYVPPTEFIPVAEASGLIESIGQCVMREALKQARTWPEDTVVAVNLSPVQFKSQRLLATVVAALAESGMPAHRLELEVTESVFIEGGEDVRKMLENLRTLGVRIALDDFGTGYSSLSYLRRFPFDKIKIDKLFIDDVTAQDESLAIIRAIVTLAEALGMSTVAEGVESEQQVVRLRDAGCTHIQGFVFSPPRAAAEICGDVRAPPGLERPARRGRTRREVRHRQEARVADRLKRGRWTRSALALQVLEQLERLFRLHALVHHRMDRGQHGLGRVRLEDIAAHVDAGGALLHGVIGHGERIELRQLLAAGHHDRHRAGGGHRLEVLVDVVGLHVLRAELGDDAAGEAEVLRVAHHVLADRGDSHDRHADAQAGVDQLSSCCGSSGSRARRR